MGDRTYDQGPCLHTTSSSSAFYDRATIILCSLCPVSLLLLVCFYIMSKHSLPVIISFSFLLAGIQAAVITAPQPYETGSIVPLHHKPLDLQPIDPLYGRVRKEAGPVGRAVTPTSTHALVYTSTSKDKEPKEEDDMRYFSEFLGLFSSVRLLHGEFTVPERYKTALRGGGMPVPGIVTPRPEVTVMEKRELPGGRRLQQQQPLLPQANLLWEKRPRRQTICSTSPNSWTSFPV
jgi:hypothetical protein